MNQALARHLQAMNPVFAREFRARWRRPLTYIIIAGYVLMWGWLSWQLYLTQQAGLGANGLLIQGNLSGRSLFIQSCWFQTFLWMIIGPALAAPAIAAEKERHMLTELLLSRLTARDVVMGKFYSAALFLLILLTIPLLSIIIFFRPNGIPPSEFLFSFLQQASIAIAGVAFGIACSAWSPKTSTALGFSLAIGVFCAVFLSFCGIYNTRLFLSFNLITVAASAGITFLCLESAIMDVSASLRELDRSESFPTMFQEENSYRPLELIPAYSGTLSPAERMVVESWSGFQYYASQRNSSPIAATATQSRWAEHGKDEPGKDEVAKEEPVLVAEGPRERSVETRYLDRREVMVSWLKRWIESNPLIQREWRVRWRFKSSNGYAEDTTVDFRNSRSPATLAGWFGTGLVLAVLTGMMPVETQWRFTLILGVLIVAYCAITASTTFIRERDQDTLLMLLLTRLSPREIVWGKVSFPIALTLAHFAPVLCIFAGWTMAHPTNALGQLVLIFALGWCSTALGIFFSRFFRTTTFATLGAIGGSLLLFLLTPPVIDPAMGRVISGMNWLANGPAFPHSGGVPYTFNFLVSALNQASYLLLVGAVLLCFVMRSLRPAMLDGESRSLMYRDLSRNLT